MKLIDHLTSFNAIPLNNQTLYSLQAIQNYREIQNLTQAKKTNLDRETSITNIQKSGIENNIQIAYQKIKETQKPTQKYNEETKITYEPVKFLFTNKKSKNIYSKGLNIDILI